MENKILTGIIVAAVALGLLGTGAIYANAQTEIRAGQNIVQRIAETFNLNEADVQAVFNAQKAEIQAQFTDRTEERLSALVNEGKITEEQKNLLTQKMNEMKLNKEELLNVTPEERRFLMEQKRTEWENRLKENNIDPRIIDSIKIMGRGEHKF